MQSIRYFSLFTGIGGFEVGINQAFEDNRTLRSSLTKKPHISPSRNSTLSLPNARAICVGYSEIDKYADLIYQRHFPNHKNWGDIKTIDAQALPNFDLLCGGFPCQAFSIAGRRQGFNDKRGALFFEIARIIKQKQPRYLLLENVKGLLSHRKGYTALTILSILDELGYDCQWQVLNSKHFGLPQNRERVFIVGYLRGTSKRQIFPLKRTQCNWVGSHKTTCKVSVKKPIIRRLTPIECERLQGFPDDWTAGVSDTQRYFCLGNAVSTYVVEHIVRTMFA